MSILETPATKCWRGTEFGDDQLISEGIRITQAGLELIWLSLNLYKG